MWILEFYAARYGIHGLRWNDLLLESEEQADCQICLYSKHRLQLLKHTPAITMQEPVQQDAMSPL